MRCQSGAGHRAMLTAPARARWRFGQHGTDASALAVLATWPDAAGTVP